MANVPIVVPQGQTRRMTRSPRHTFQIAAKPFTIQPFMIAPVLPGETMKNALIQSRAVSDPIRNALVGWWLEYYFFYVKHRDLDGRDDFSDMMLDLDKDLSSYNSAADVKYYHAASSINWTKLCLKRIVEEYFRNEDEAWDNFTIDSMPVAKVNSDGIFNSALLDDNYAAAEDVTISTAGDNAFTTSEVETAMRTWQFQRANRLTEMDYEDWLATYGIRPAPAENHRPELLRYIREWQYPSNTVNPADGVPSSAVSWAITDRIDKDRFFREPGFIVGVTVSRPKVYFSNQTSAVVDWMSDALSWLPAIMRDDPYTSLKKFAETAGPAQIVTDAGGYWVDIKDLFIYGDQFSNFALSTAGSSAVALPTTALQALYPQASDVTGLFKSGGTEYVRQDGVVQLSILGALEDTSPQMRRLR